MLPEVVFRARNGAKASFRKHGFHIKRNYDETPAGMIWVSDHAQIDIACSYTDETGRERYTFPWVTAWRDFKSGKWMGWEVYPGNPNSDHIFAAMYIGMEEHGIPMMAYLDNGKDYRSKDFSGGRSTIRVSVDEFHTRSLLGQLQIEPIFAWPYNPQSKPIERDFLRNKEWLSKHAKGYRGGNVVERPEGLNARVAAGDIESIDELRKTFDVFISEVVNKSAVSSGHRAGMCPNEIWDAEVAQTVALGGLKRVSKDALKLFCSRTSGDICIRGRGVRDSVLGIDYYDHWMLAFKGRKVYMRRDPRRYEEAWVFDSATNECLGKGFLLAEAPAMARTDVQREQLAQAIATKRRTEKIIKSYAQKPEDEVPLAEKIEYMAAATALINKERGYTPTEQQLQSNTTMVTQMDHVLAEQKRRDEIGKQDYGTSLPPEGKGDYDEIDPWQAYAAG
jgi:transposase InsO family protein